MLCVARAVALPFALSLPATAQTFTDASDLLGTFPEMGTAGFGASIVDFDGDGRADLFRRGAAFLQRDEGFVRSFALGELAPWSAFAADFDGDGLTEVAMGGFLDEPLAVALYEVSPAVGFRLAEGQQLPVAAGGSTLDQGAAWLDFDRDGLLDLFVGDDGPPDDLYRNLGHGLFENVSALLPDLPASTYGVAVADYDRDGDSDIYLAICAGNPEERINKLYRNDGAAFTEVAAEVGLADDGDGWGVVWLDYDNDGWLDLYVANTSVGEDGLSNRLYRNTGGTFTDVTASAGVGGSANSYGANAADLDNDGWVDLLPGDLASATWLRNTGGTFEPLPFPASRSSMTAVGDVDQDGFVDVFLPRGRNGGDVLLLNDGNQNHHLTVSLRGVASNRSGIGARVEVQAGELSMVREIQSGSGMMSHNHGLTAHFGLGQAAEATVTVRWPSGQVDTIEGVAADQAVRVVEGEGLNAPPAFFRPLAPADGAAVEGDAAPLAWEPAIDPEGALAGYTIYVVAPGGAEQEIAVGPEATALELPLAETGLYRWRVVADDGRSLRASGAAWSFSNGALAAEVPPGDEALSLRVGPNPTRDGFTAWYALPAAAEVRMEVVDVLGRVVAEVEAGRRPAGEHEVRMAETLPAGTYVVRVQTSEAAAHQRVTVLR